MREQMGCPCSHTHGAPSLRPMVWDPKTSSHSSSKPPPSFTKREHKESVFSVGRHSGSHAVRGPVVGELAGVGVPHEGIHRTQREEEKAQALCAFQIHSYLGLRGFLAARSK